MTAQLTATFSSGTLLSAESPRIACNSDDISNMDGCADEGDGGRHHAAATRKRRQRVAAAQQRIERRLEEAAPSADCGRPMMGAASVCYEVATRTDATIHGGIALAHRVAVLSGLVAAIDKRVGF
jgi:hypothetical protein